MWNRICRESTKWILNIRNHVREDGRSHSPRNTIGVISIGYIWYISKESNKICVKQTTINILHRLQSFIIMLIAPLPYSIEYIDSCIRITPKRIDVMITRTYGSFEVWILNLIGIGCINIIRLFRSQRDTTPNAINYWIAISRQHTTIWVSRLMNSNCSQNSTGNVV